MNIKYFRNLPKNLATQRSELRRYISAVVLGSALCIFTSAPAEAKKKPMEPPPCPVDGPIRVSNSDSIRGIESLEGCRAQIVESPADEPRDTRDTVRVKGLPESPYGSNTDDVYSRKARRGASARDQEYPEGAYVITSAGGVRSLRIVPEADEVQYAATYSDLPKGAVAASSNADIRANPEAILGLRPGTYRTSFDDMIEQVARRHRIDPLFLHAVITQESGYRPGIGSHAGARGLMQIMPATGRMLGLDPSQLTNPAANVDAGARLLRKLHKRYNGDFTLVLAAYNAGEGAVQKYGNRVPPYRETQNYVKAVMAHYSKLVAGSAAGKQAASTAQ